MAFQDRITDFSNYLTANAIPFSGIQNSNGTPEGLTIDFLPAATAEQIAWANDALAAYDWRNRRMLARNTIVNTLASLTAAQQNAIVRHIVAAYIREHKAEALDLLATLQQNVPIDEVVPNP